MDDFQIRGIAGLSQFFMQTVLSTGQSWLALSRYPLVVANAYAACFLWVSGGQLLDSINVGGIHVVDHPKFAESDVSLIVYDDEGLSGMLLNVNGASCCGLIVDSEIMQVAKVVDE